MRFVPSLWAQRGCPLFRLGRPALSCLLFASLILCLSAPVLSQEPQPAGTKPAEPSAAAEKAPSENLERLIYLPYRNLKDVFDKHGATAFMPYSQFQTMWEQLRALGTKGPATPPVPAVITEAKYTGRVEKDLAHITADFTVQVLGQPWAELPIQFGDAAIGRITSPDNEVLLQGTGNGTYKLLFPKTGEQKIQLELVTRVRTSPDGRSIELDCPPSAVTTLDFQVPVADQTIEITPKMPVTQVEPAADAKVTHIQAQLGATRKIAARWHPQVSTAPVMELLASVQNVLDVRIADGLVHTHATLTFQVMRGQLDQVRIGVPVGHRILDVSAPGLKAWKTEVQEKQQVVTVDLLSATSKSIAVEVHTERPSPAEAFQLAGIEADGTVHGIHTLGAVRESGLLIVSHAPDLALTVEQQSGVVRVEAAEVPQGRARPEALFYKFYSPQFQLQASVKAVEPRLLVDHATQLVFGDDELQLSSQLQYTIERAGVFELRFQLPENITIDRVDCEPMKEFQVSPDKTTLVVSLREKTQGQIQIAIQGHLPFDPASKDTFKLPVLQPLSVARESGSILVYAPEVLEVITDDRGIVSAQPNRPDASAAQRFPHLRLASAWTYTRRPVEIPVRIERKPTRLTASVGTSINIRQDQVEVNTTLSYDVQYAGIDTFQFAVPEKGVAANTVQIESGDPTRVSIKQKSRADAAEDGWITWTVVTQREVTGHVPLLISYTLQPEQKANTLTMAVHPIRVLPSPGRTDDAPVTRISGLSGEISVYKDRALSISAKAEDLEAIDVRELTRLPQDGYLAYRYFKQPEQFKTPFQLQLTASRHEIQDVIQTVIVRALIEAVVTEDTAITYRCRYRLKTSERQRLKIELPAGAEIFDKQVAGKSVDLEKDEAGPRSGQWQSYFINVARKTRADEPFVLSLVFRAPYRDKPLRGWGGALSLLLPRIGGTDAQNQPLVPVQQLRTVVWVPEEFDLVSKPPKFTSTTPQYFSLSEGVQSTRTDGGEQDIWFGDSATGLFDFRTAGHSYQYDNLGGADSLNVNYWQTARFTWVISGALVLIAFILMQTSWENRLTLLLLGALAAALIALRDADLVLHFLAAARYGLLAMLAIWLIHGLTRLPRSLSRPAPAYTGPITGGGAIAAVIPPPGVFDNLKSNLDRPK